NRRPAGPRIPRHGQAARALARPAWGPPHHRPAQRRPAGLQPPAGRAARVGGAVHRAAGQRLGAAPLAGPAVPPPGQLPRRRRPGLPRPLAPPGPRIRAITDTLNDPLLLTLKMAVTLHCLLPL